MLMVLAPILGNRIALFFNSQQLYFDSNQPSDTIPATIGNLVNCNCILDQSQLQLETVKVSCDGYNAVITIRKDAEDPMCPHCGEYDFSPLGKGKGKGKAAKEEAAHKKAAEAKR